MKRLVRFDDFLIVALIDMFGDFDQQPFHQFQFLFGDPFCSQSGRQTVQGGSDFKHLVDVLERQIRYVGATSGQHDHKAFQFQFTDRLPDWCAADT